MKNNILQKDLINILGDRYSTSESTRLNYSRGEDIFEPILSQAVVFPNTNEEISKRKRYFISIFLQRPC